MENFPLAVQEVIYEHVIGDRPVGILELDANGNLKSSCGDLKFFGIDDLNPEIAVDEQLDFLAGLLDPASLPLELPFLEMPSGMSTDVHIFTRDECLWILLIGVEDQSIRQQSAQQRVNDMSLTYRRQVQILNQYLGTEVARRLEDGIDSVETSGERRSLTMMFADIRGFTTFSEKSQPEDVFEALNIYLGAMIPVVIDDHGVIDKIIGDEVMAIFGMLPDHSDGPNNGLRASIHMLLAIENLNRVRRQDDRTLLQIGIGMASGPVSLGVLGSQHRKSITVIGNHVNLASRLQSLAGPNQLIIDYSTYQYIGQFKQYFSKQQVELKGFSKAVEVYLLEAGLIQELAEKLDGKGDGGIKF